MAKGVGTSQGGEVEWFWSEKYGRMAEGVGTSQGGEVEWFGSEKYGKMAEGVVQDGVCLDLRSSAPVYVF